MSAADASDPVLVPLSSLTCRRCNRPAHPHSYRHPVLLPPGARLAEPQAIIGPVSAHELRPPYQPLHARR